MFNVTPKTIAMAWEWDLTQSLLMFTRKASRNTRMMLKKKGDDK